MKWRKREEGGREHVRGERLDGQDEQESHERSKNSEGSSERPLRLLHIAEFEDHFRRRMSAQRNLQTWSDETLR